MVFQDKGCSTLWSFKQGVLHCVVFQDKGCCNDSLSRQGVLHCVVFQDRGCYTVLSFKTDSATLCGLSRLTVPVLEDIG